jgi:hypothetical protein
MNADFTYFFKVILDGYYEAVCSKCDMMLTEDPEVSIIYAGPCNDQNVRCAICGVRTDAAEEDEAKSDQ